VTPVPASAIAVQNRGGVADKVNTALRAVQWGLDRVLSVGYGVAYDYIVESFRPYREMYAEVLAQVEAAVPPAVNRREVRVLDVACGPGNLTCMLAEAGFETVGLDHYQGLIDLAREKRLAKHLPNLSFRYGSLYKGRVFAEASFDQLVSVHSIYLHPDPARFLQEAHRVLKPGGHAVFVNLTRRMRFWPTLQEVKEREGLSGARRSLAWLVPNSIFETMRKGAGRHYWGEEELIRRLREAGFTVLDVRPTFFNAASRLVWVQKAAAGAEDEERAIPAAAPLPQPPAVPLPAAPQDRSRARNSVERLIAASYGFGYDAIVESFEPYRALLGEVRGFIERAFAGCPPAAVKVLDVACGTGTVARELAGHGYSVTGVDVVAPLVRVARERRQPVAGALEFEHLDVASDPVPGAGTYDVVVSMHTLYWHPKRAELLEGCRRALKPGGHALFLTYSRPARVLRTFREVRAGKGTVAAVRALRWLVPTALFESFRDYQPHYMAEEEFRRLLTEAGFEILETRRTFLAGISLLAWVRAGTEPRPGGALSCASEAR
jgi:2-polyprenyl-3-methyl-5-hydroxy-6-metoxy-1,4-benzoquinol methylase